MPTVSVKVDGLKEAKAMFDPKKVKQATKWALGDVGREVKKEGEKAIEERYNLKKTDFKANVKLIGIKDDTLTMLITASRRSGKDYYGIPASYFGATEIRSTRKGMRVLSRHKSKVLSNRKVSLLSGSQGGVVVQIRRDGKVASFPNAFITKMKSGHIGVFIMDKKKMMISKPKKQALMELATESFPSLFSSKSGADKEPLTRMKKKAGDVWEEVFWKKLEGAMGVTLSH